MVLKSAMLFQHLYLIPFSVPLCMTVIHHVVSFLFFVEAYKPINILFFGSLELAPGCFFLPLKTLKITFA